MSKTIDERVVSMQFDNRNFESNVKTTMTTLDKLKERLNLSGASKGLESVNAAAKNCNLSPIGSAVETVKVKFSALQVAALTCLQNITNQAFNTGKSILNSLTIQPVTTGFNEYELKMNSIQTIMASTGESLETVNGYLNELNRYSDETIYSFSDMTANIGKFTNAGIKLEDAVVAIKGIANEAALSGANANEAARAMYNFSQALSTGYVQRIDWKSIELANMATVEFKEQLLEQAVAMNTVKKNADGMYAAINDDKFYNTSQMFIECLDEQWLTSEVLIETLKNYADATTDIGARATKAATEVKTFSHMMDTLRESAQSGWAQSWEAILGDFNEGKTLWTSLNEVIGGWISKSADKRNNMLAGALDSNWEKFAKKIEAAGIPLEDFQKLLVETGKEHAAQTRLMVKGEGEKKRAFSESKGEYIEVTDEMIEAEGGFVKSLRKGWLTSDIVRKSLQKLVGASGEYSEVTAEAQTYTVQQGDALYRIAEQYGMTWQELYELNREIIKNPNLIYAGQVLKVSAAQETQIETLAELSDEQLRANGYTDEQIEALRELQRVAEDTGVELDELVNNMSDVGGRQKLIDAFATLYQKIAPIAQAVKDSWNAVFADFPSMSEIIGKVIDKFAEFVDDIEINQDTIDSISTTITGLATALKTLALFSGGAVGYFFKIINMVANELDVDFLNLTETIAELIIKFYNWITTNNALYDSVVKIGEAFVNFATTAIGAITDVFNRVLTSERILPLITLLGDSFTTMLGDVTTWCDGFMSVFERFIDALFNMEKLDFGSIALAFGDLVSGIFDELGNIASSISKPFKRLKSLLIGFFAELTNESGSQEEYALNFVRIREAIDGLLSPISNFLDKLKEWKTTFKAWVESLKTAEDLPKAIGEGIGRAIASLLNSVKDWVVEISTALWNGMFNAGTDTTDGLVSGLGKGLRAVVSTIWNIGVAIISTICSVLDINSPSKVMIAIGAFVILGLVKGLQTYAPDLWSSIASLGVNLFTKFKDALITVIDWIKKLNFGQLLSAALTSGLLVAVYKMVVLGTRIANAAADILEGFAAIPKNIGKFFGGLGEMLGETKADKFKKYAAAIKTLAIAIGILAASLFVLNLIPSEKIWGLVGVLGTVMGIFAAFAAVVGLAERFGKISALDFGALAWGLVGIAAAMGIMSLAVSKLAAVVDAHPENFYSAVNAIGGLLIILLGMTTILGAYSDSDVMKNVNKAAKVIFKVGIVMLMLAYVTKTLSAIKGLDLLKGVAAIAAFALVVVGIQGATEFMKDVDLNQFGGLILKIGAAFAMMAGVMYLLKDIPWPDLAKGAVALIGFAVLLSAFIKSFDKVLMMTNVDKIAYAVLSVASSILILAVAAKIIASMSVGELFKAGIAIAALGVGIWAMIQALDDIHVGKLDNIGITLIAAAASILILAGAMKLLSNMTFDQWAAGMFSIMILVIMIAGLLSTIGSIDAGSLKGVGSTLLMAAAAIATLAIIAGVIGILDFFQLAKGVVAITILAGMIALIVKVTEKAQDAKGTLIGLAIVAAVLAAAVVALALVGSGDNLYGLLAAGGVMAALLALVALVVWCSKAIENVKIGPLLGIAAIVAVLGGAVFALAQLDSTRAILGATALGIAMIAFAAAAAIVNKFGASFRENEFKNNIKTLGMLAGIAVVLATIIYVLSSLDPAKAMHAAMALGIAMIGFSTAMLLINKFAIVNSVKNLGNTIKLLFSLAAVAVVIGVVLRIIGSMDFGSAIGAAISLSVVLAVLVGALLVLENFGGLGMGVSSMTGSLLAMSVALIAIGAAMLIIAQIPKEKMVGVVVGLSVALVVLTAALAALAWAFTTFAPGAALIVSILLSFAVAAIAVGAAAVLVGVGATFMAEAVTTAAMALPLLAEGLGMLITTLADCSNSAWKFVETSAALVIGMVLITVASALLLVSVVLLGAGLILAAGVIVIFSAALVLGAGAVYLLADSILFLGYAIGEGLIGGIASCIEGVSKAVSSLGNAIVGTICNILGIASPSKVMQLIGKFVGEGFALGITDSEGSVSSAAGGLAEAARGAFGVAGAEGGAEFTAKAQTTMDTGSLASSTGLNSGALAEAAKTSMGEAGAEGGTAFNLGAMDGLDIESITSMMGMAGAEGGTAFNTEALASMDFSSLMSGEGFDMSSMTSMFGDLGLESGTAFSLGASENASMQPTLDAMLGEISGSTPQFTEAGTTVLTAFGDGLAEASVVETDELCASVASMATAVRAKRTDFYTVGGYLVEGFAQGVRDKTWIGKNAARDLARAAINAAKKELGIQSPSREFMEIGEYVPEGFILGIEAMSGAIDKSVESMAGEAIDTTKDIIARISDAVNSDIDTQPTIRPVLDLSEVRSGVASIGGIFGMAPSVRAMSNIGAISTMMRGSGQNGNDDVVSAIDKLRKDLGNISSNTYQINGVTYDDGSNIADAVRTITRAAVMERRM